jgi:5-methylcytosine-specific restriction endonuclease McrA
MKRKAITNAMKLEALFIRGLVICAACKDPITDPKDCEWDHVHQLAMGGAHAADNISPKHCYCHKIKTKADARARAHVRRLTGANKPRVKKRIPAHVGGIPSRPFRRPAAQQTGER